MTVLPRSCFWVMANSFKHVQKLTRHLQHGLRLLIAYTLQALESVGFTRAPSCVNILNKDSLKYSFPLWKQLIYLHICSFLKCPCISLLLVMLSFVRDFPVSLLVPYFQRKFCPTFGPFAWWRPDHRIYSLEKRQICPCLSLPRASTGFISLNVSNGPTWLRVLTPC